MIINCPSCGQKNRISEKHTKSGHFTCGACATEIAKFKPKRFAVLRNSQTLRTFIGSLVAIFLSVVVMYFLAEALPTNSSPTSVQVINSTDVLQPVSSQSTPEIITPSDHKAFALPNGAELTRPHKKRGSGELNVSNGSDRDAVVKLITTNSNPKVYRAIYVRAGCDAKLSSIKGGSYKIKFCAGRDWSKERKAFVENPSFFQFDDPITFEETIERSSDATQLVYSTYHITLQGVVNGNAHTSAVSKDDFDVPEED